MTAMCDVAFLLLSFFILTTKFKPSEAVPINTPSSVASKVAPEKDIFMISLNKDGKVFLSVGDGVEDKDNFRAIIQGLNTAKSLGLSDAQITALSRQPLIGVSLAQLPQQATMQNDQLTAANLPGVTVKDTLNNEMNDWLRSVAEVYQGRHANIILKGDNLSKYPTFKYIIAALKKNDLLKFQMVTNPEAVPTGSQLWKDNASGKKES
jgi:biopolymer transport protein ExbD